MYNGLKRATIMLEYKINVFNLKLETRAIKMYRTTAISSRPCGF